MSPEASLRLAGGRNPHFRAPRFQEIGSLSLNAEVLLHPRAHWLRPQQETPPLTGEFEGEEEQGVSGSGPPLLSGAFTPKCAQSKASSFLRDQAASAFPRKAAEPGPWCSFRAAGNRLGLFCCN